MRYAIGEIILVVIGILIALQINNWNEENKIRNIEIETLNEIRGNLYVDLTEISADITIMDSVNNAGKVIRNLLKRENVPSQLFKYHIHISRLYPHFDPNRSGYSLLMSEGIEIVSNDSLRGAITKLYEQDYPYYSKYENERVSLISHVYNPRIVDYFSFEWSDEGSFKGTSEISQDNYLKMINDTSFINTLQLVIYQNELVKNRAEIILGYITDLISQIEIELESKR